MPEDLAIRYDRLAKSTGRTKTFYMTEALAAEIDRLEYEYGLLKKVEDYRAGRLETVTLDELEESLGLSMLIIVLDLLGQIAVEVYAHVPALAAVGVLARTLEHAPSRLHRGGDAPNLVGHALKTNPDHDNLLALNPAPPSVAQPKRTAQKKSEKV